MCVSNLEFQRVNPTTQVALFSFCVGNCSTIQNITWNIYHGTTNLSSNFTQWTLFNQTTSYQDIWFFGRTILLLSNKKILLIFLGTNTSNFTAINELFLINPEITLWRFEVVYTFSFETSWSSFNFVLNQPPCNGSCSISSFNGTTSTLFDISCPNWFDDDGIQDYSIYSMCSYYL
jgi:hypothetical protein